MKLVAPLNSFGRGDLVLAGGKGANLGELVKNGFPVPGGFVVTTHAFDLVAQGHTSRAYFEQIELPGELRQAIADAYAALGAGPVAVRSSATAEDLPGAAFAGQQDTYLNVVGEEALLDAVRRCWGSLWTDRAVAYRARLAIHDSEVSIAVVVQSMVEADTAGVMFTANPVSGDRTHLVIDASSGLGEAVVSGLVTPDHYVVDAAGGVDFTPGRREVVIRGMAGGGVARETGAAVERLPDAVVQELAALGRRVAGHFGRPQDIEWAYAGGRVHLLQARPMTALPPPPVGRLNPIQRRLAGVLLEYLPVRPYPIDTTTWLPYGPAGLMGKVTGAFGLRRGFEGFLREEDGVVYALIPPKPHPSIGVLAAPFRIVTKARRYDPARWTEDRRFLDYLAAVRQLAARDLAAMPWPELIRVPRQALALVAPVAGLRIDYLPGTGLALLRLLLALKLLRRGKLFGGLMFGAVTRTTEANQALTRLAELARRTGALDADPPPAEFRAAFEEFMAEYGHRETASPILVTPPTWSDDPETVLGLIRVLAAEPPPRKEGDDALERLLAHPLLRSPRRRARMRRWVEAARAGTAFREDSHFSFTMPQPILRRSLVELGRRLRDAGVLDRPEDVFHLRLEELESIGDASTLPGADRDRLREVARARAVKREELAGVRLIDHAAVFPAREMGDALVAGSPAAGGVATGPVKVIREPAEFGKLDGGDVLVCPYTNPSWTPLFQQAAAVVVDSGGAASHAAIVAREYGIPAVMGTGTGTSVLEDGRLVTVDGDTGTVTSAA
ncbi:PEP/pyruvate-binding domain-containing protein [Nonomuraea basaltis]|uniref:PEP/pyruvate-binding domain-containing protein n=1 Tax=Nonomuraea basaltis TaxID=2495887 RepID=UPI00110C547F|nr:PEP/pyruvate-binding domain-containing protein [Nonomuraea basaltis]TMR99036.1 phosphoenolpyruvate synthase [Nonomuraea basaltis]